MAVVRKLERDPLGDRKSTAHILQDDRRSAVNYLETTVLEESLAKISDLLRIGFGVAGTDIIRANISRGGELDPLIPGW